MILIVENIKKLEVDKNLIPREFIKNKYSIYEYYFIKKVLNEFYDINEFEVKYTKNGKPFIDNDNIYFSISHDNNILAICFDKKPVGIDLQFFVKDYDALKQFLNLDTDDGKEVIKCFSNREAVIKLEGLALKNINEIDVTRYKIHTMVYNEYMISIANYNS